MSEFKLIDLIDLPLKRRVDSGGFYVPDGSAVAERDPQEKSCGWSAKASATVIDIRARGFDLTPKIPATAPAEGEQYRFHFDASRCIGCECCVVACNEQNNNPSEVNWRRVGEIEGGRFPSTKRLYLSMGCNHCLEPSCLTGCPTDAYEKDPATGIVRHKADSCIGCQYCMWNCPYGVPQYNPDRGIVTKCDMCYGRLAAGQAPACVSACPEQAIRIEIVKKDDWRADHAEADAPGLPDSSHTLSTTRITLPKDVALDTAQVNGYRLAPEDPHTPLIFLLTLTQLSVGGFIALWLGDLAAALVNGHALYLRHRDVMAFGMLFVAGLALAVSILHLGRPLHAWKALRMWKRSWLSREVLFFGLFSNFAALYAGGSLLETTALGSRIPPSIMIALGSLVAVSGLAGIFASGRIYMVPARPSWNSPRTLVRFFMTALMLGPLFAVTLLLGSSLVRNTGVVGVTFSVALMAMVAGAAFSQVLSLLSSLIDLVRQESPELRGTAQLLTGKFRDLFLVRLGTLTVGGLLIPAVLAYALPQVTAGGLEACFHAAAAAFGIALAGEFIGRYLFFVTVVPRNVAGAFFES